MNIPRGEELLPEFMQAATNFVLALAVYFGLHAITSFALMRGYVQSFAHFSNQYVYVLSNVIYRQNVFYLLHLLPALGVRYFFEARLPVKPALCAAFTIAFAALVIVYPRSSLFTPAVLKNILRYVSPVPFLMTLYTLRINRLKFSGGIVLFIFIAMLAMGSVARTA